MVSGLGIRILELFVDPAVFRALEAEQRSVFMVADGPLRPRVITALHYPPALRDAGIEGTAVVATIVDPNGDVAAAEVMSAGRPSGSGRVPRGSARPRRRRFRAGTSAVPAGDSTRPRGPSWVYRSRRSLGW
jgi:hypothetical protein